MSGVCRGIPLVRYAYAYSLHALRHTFATALLARNKSPKVVQDLLGHSSITVTLDLYTANLDDLGREAVESLDIESRSPISGS